MEMEVSDLTDGFHLCLQNVQASQVWHRGEVVEQWDCELPFQPTQTRVAHLVLHLSVGFC